MKRSRLKADPEKVREWIERSRRKSAESLKRSMLERRTPIKPVNRKRKKRLFEKQFGDKSRWMREAYPACLITGRPDPDHAHVLGTRGAGADSSGIVPLDREVHRDFDNVTDDAFLLVWEHPKEWVRDRAREIHQEWLAVCQPSS